ncbi:hypothetical protein [Planobispora takensis]|uniref:Cell division protein FtsL n=1 Tax=Planobispora takensis TaxID=1367882 RepID=A0A8J3WUA4_9ACTN|nr:hypothetical protein [Planobispora takensis]GII02426.1 hypothetical protein Pta02_44340 [Planobispora takensis]
MRLPRANPRSRRPGPVQTAPETRPASQGPVEAQVPVAAPAPVRSGAPRRARAPRAPFVLLLVGLLCGGLVTLLLLNTVLAQGSFQESQLRNEIKKLSQAEEERRNVILQLEMPDRLSKSAEGQGQQPGWENSDVITLDGSTGTGQTPAGQEPVGAGR